MVAALGEDDGKRVEGHVRVESEGAESQGQELQDHWELAVRPASVRSPSPGGVRTVQGGTPGCGAQTDPLFALDLGAWKPERERRADEPSRPGSERARPLFEGREGCECQAERMACSILGF